MPEKALVELIVQGGVGVGALVLMLIFGQRVLKAAKETLDAALKARDRDIGEARAERQEMFAAYRAEAAAQRELDRESVREILAGQAQHADRIVTQMKDHVRDLVERRGQ